MKVSVAVPHTHSAKWFVTCPHKGTISATRCHHSPTLPIHPSCPHALFAFQGHGNMGGKKLPRGYENYPRARSPHCKQSHISCTDIKLRSHTRHREMFLAELHLGNYMAMVALI